MLTRLLLLLGFLVAQSTSPIFARSAATGAKVWGLLGTWALDCSAGPSQANGYLTYEPVSGNQLIHKRDYGAIKDEHPVIEAKLLDDGALELVFDFSALSPPQRRRVVVERVSIDGIRARENQVVGTSDFSIRDGKFVHNGKPVPVQTRCLSTL
jgi:hypothetical protein